MEPFTKPYQGAITNWRLDTGRVCGLLNGVTAITTSPMIRIQNIGVFGILETRNSTYILLDAMPSKRAGIDA